MNHEDPPAALRGKTCQVLKIFDGDTLGCDLNGNHHIEKPDEFIRLIGIDAPEMHYSRKNKQGKDQPYALEATNFLKKNTLKRVVYLEMDKRPKDRYGRLLAYLYLSPTAPFSLNELLLQQGYAEILFIAPNVKYQQRFETQQAQAKTAKKGIWQAG